MSRLRALSVGAGFFWLLAIAGCGINPQPEPPSADETQGSGGSIGSGGAGGGGEGGHYAADPDAADGTVPPASGLPDGGNDKRNDDFSNEDPSANTDYNGAFGNIDGGAPAHDGGRDDGGDGAVADDEGEAGREPPPAPDGGLGSVMQ